MEVSFKSSFSRIYSAESFLISIMAAELFLWTLRLRLSDVGSNGLPLTFLELFLRFFLNLFFSASVPVITTCSTSSLTRRENCRFLADFMIGMVFLELMCSPFLFRKPSSFLLLLTFAISNVCISSALAVYYLDVYVPNLLSERAESYFFRLSSAAFTSLLRIYELRDFSMKVGSSYKLPWTTLTPYELVSVKISGSRLL